MTDESDLPYSEQARWKDIVPIKQDDGPRPLVSIRYPPGFEEAHDYFRAIQVANEYSERALQLTADVIEHNSANYTAWYYRRRCLSSLKSDLQAELEFTNGWARDNAKNYQVWYHRRWLIAELLEELQASDDADKAEKIEELGRQEVEYHMDCMSVNDDFKNYNGWSHRQFVVQKFNLWKGELEFVEGLLAQDIRNNSAWNHRYTVVRNAFWPLTEGTRQRELKFTIAALRRCANNESAWNYLTAFFGEGDGREPWNTRPEVEAFCLEVIAASASQEGVCRFAVEAMVHIHEAKGERAKALEQYNVLKVVDAIRATYWDWRVQLLQQQVSV
jgi:protein farnesyltransferase/geranylgeranyltransferase type-1 subunit alpha